MKAAKAFKVRNGDFSKTYGGITIPIGESVLMEADWKKFYAEAVKDPFFLMQEKAKCFVYLGEVKPLPDEIDSLSEKEALTLIANTDDHLWLKRMVLKSENQKYRAAINFRNSILAGTRGKQFYTLKIEEIPPHHYAADLYNHYRASDLLPKDG
ncbi:hypothetical protein [Chroococcus sp. FPU101]|uniref:hypothetical protein n=1 Tax=Chroococcus sp. FPU101 TaxID=1974212 RepID=UPI001A8C8544|nr:hypothetical protein [Chroococcus sp. FPU101]GFE72221.1 hypothetical protein CFPU101_48310 [Chroococcus sp. FPU101]